MVKPQINIGELSDSTAQMDELVSITFTPSKDYVSVIEYRKIEYRNYHARGVLNYINISRYVFDQYFEVFRN